MDVHPHRRVLVTEPIRQLGVGHQVEPHQAHGTTLFLFVMAGLVPAIRSIRLLAIRVSTPAAQPAAQYPLASATSGARIRQTCRAASASPFPRKAACCTW